MLVCSRVQTWIRFSLRVWDAPPTPGGARGLSEGLRLPQLPLGRRGARHGVGNVSPAGLPSPHLPPRAPWPLHHLQGTCDFLAKHGDSCPHPQSGVARGPQWRGTGGLPALWLRRLPPSWHWRRPCVPTREAGGKPFSSLDAAGTPLCPRLASVCGAWRGPFPSSPGSLWTRARSTQGQNRNRVFKPAHPSALRASLDPSHPDVGLWKVLASLPDVGFWKLLRQSSDSLLLSLVSLRRPSSLVEMSLLLPGFPASESSAPAVGPAAFSMSAVCLKPSPCSVSSLLWLCSPELRPGDFLKCLAALGTAPTRMGAQRQRALRPGCVACSPLSSG